MFSFRTSKTRHLATTLTARCFAAMATALLASSFTLAANRKTVLFNNVSLACWIENEKVVAVVNSTGKTLPLGTMLTVDATPIPDGPHFVRSAKIAQTPSGGIIRIGAVSSASCTASARLPLPDLKAQ
jgi:hypothetical protein